MAMVLTAVAETVFVSIPQGCSCVYLQLKGTISIVTYGSHRNSRMTVEAKGENARMHLVCCKDLILYGLLKSSSSKAAIPPLLELIFEQYQPTISPFLVLALQSALDCSKLHFESKWYIQAVHCAPTTCH
jgi:hypothetical protein